MNLEFKEDGNGMWTAEFVATSNFNLHVEKERTGYISVDQRGTETGMYARAFTTNSSADNVRGMRVFDYDFGALVYPKWIRVQSAGEVLSATVTFSE